MPPPKADQATSGNARSTEQRLADLQEHVLDHIEKLFSPEEAARRHDEFEKRVERELYNRGRLILRTPRRSAER